METGHLSVVVTGGASERLAATLGSLALEGRGLGRLEVIVVRPWPEPAVAIDPPAGLEVRALDVAAPSPTAAANAGLDAAGGDAVVLLAAGDEPREGVLAGHLAALAAGACAVVGG